MKTTFVSTQAFSNANRHSIVKMQVELARAQREVASGRLADVGLSLGAQTGQTVSLRQEHARLMAISDTNGQVSARLETTQSALDGLRNTAQGLLNALLDVGRSGDAADLLQNLARSTLEAFTGTLSATHNGEYIFAGINTDVLPLADYFSDPPSAAKAAVDAAFLAEFGFAQDDPQVTNISGAEMQAFLETSFADLFEPAAWVGTWSSASEQNIRSRISPAELIDTGVNANESAVRNMAMAFTMVTDLGGPTMNAEAFQAVIDKAVQTIGGATEEFTMVQARLGIVQERVESANQRMSLQRDILVNHVNALEAVDPYEASTRITTLMTQIETAYALTARIQQLSLLNYL